MSGIGFIQQQLISLAFLERPGIGLGPLLAPLMGEECEDEGCPEK